MSTAVQANPLEETVSEKKIAEPCVMVIFGATGDLTGRKLLPALYNLARDNQLPSHFACVGFARRNKTNEDFRKEMLEAVNKYSRIKPVNQELWKTFGEQLFYHRSDFENDEGYEQLQQVLQHLDAKFGTKGNRVYYLSIPPSEFPLVIEKLRQHRLIYDANTVKDKWSRVIIKSPLDTT